MFRGQLVMAAPLALAVLAAPMAVVVGNANASDPSNLYIVIGMAGDLENDVTRLDLAEVGAYRAPFARMVHASAQLHEQLVDMGYLTLPAGALADLCGTNSRIETKE